MRVNFPTVPGVKIIKVGTAKGLNAGQGLNVRLAVKKYYYESAHVVLELKSEGYPNDFFFVKFQHKAKLPLLYGDYGWATVFECCWYGSYSPSFEFEYPIPPKAGDEIRVVGYLKKAEESDFEEEPLLDKTYSDLIDVDWGSGYVDILALYPTLPFEEEDVDWSGCNTGHAMFWWDLPNYKDSGIIVFYENADNAGKARCVVYGSWFWTHPHPGFKSDERFAATFFDGDFEKSEPYYRYYIYWGPTSWFYDRRNEFFPDGGLIQMLRSGFYSRD